MTRITTPIVGATLGTPIHYNTYAGHAISGDIWDAAWADDGQTYCLVDDVIVWDTPLNANLALVSWGDSRPPDLQGHIVNPLRAFGTLAELAGDGACWKANGLTCIDGVFYLTVSRHWYGHTRPDGVQIARDASIVVSPDHGRTWSPTPPQAQPFAQPLFPGAAFATPFFVKYGRDGAAPPPAPDEADRYVYAVSNDGFWDNGNAMHLGRVLRTDLPRLRLEDWEFMCGLVDDQPQWINGEAGMAAIQPVLAAPQRCGQAGIQYLPGLGRYLMAQWFYPDLRGSEGAAFAVGHSRWEWYEAPYPWGPWELFQSWDWPTEGFYNPSLPTAFISPDSTNLWLLTTGDFRTTSGPLETSQYTLYLIPATLHLGAPAQYEAEP